MMPEACPHRPACPGCPHYGESGVDADALGLLRIVAAEMRVALDPVLEGEASGFRRRARLAVRGRASSPKIGIFEQGSHRVVDIPRCPVQHPRINAVARELRESMRLLGVTPYNESSHRGLLRYVQVVVERSTGDVQVVLVANDHAPASLEPLADELARRLEGRLQGLWWNGNTGTGNAILGSEWTLLRGRDAVEETIGGARVFFPPGAFGQSNLALADRLVDDVQARVAPGAVVAELYCGVGAFGLGLAQRGHEVRFNEVSPHGLEGLRRGLACLGEGAAARTTVVEGEASGAVSLLHGADAVVVDPPRKGLDEAVVGALVRERPGQLLYVSCNPRSLGRDVGQLCGGGFTLKRLTPYAMFPYTTHVETVAEFVAG